MLQESAARPRADRARGGRAVRRLLPPAHVDETLELVGLAARPRVATALSGGQRRRLDLALALVGDPELLFLDEPTTGFDPSARRAAWDIIDGLRDLGKTILLTTHYMDEAERLADRIVVIAPGASSPKARPRRSAAATAPAATITFTLPAAAEPTACPRRSPSPAAAA